MDLSHFLLYFGKVAVFVGRRKGGIGRAKASSRGLFPSDSDGGKGSPLESAFLLVSKMYVPTHTMLGDPFNPSTRNLPSSYFRKGSPSLLVTSSYLSIGMRPPTEREGFKDRADPLNFIRITDAFLGGEETILCFLFFLKKSASLCLFCGPERKKKKKGGRKEG